MESSDSLGFYGKLPYVGDFVTRRVPREFTEPWDNWLQEAITRSREHLAERWLEAYLISPIWRFALNAGVCGNAAWTGVLMPSVDKVGRHFPLTLVLRLPEESNLFRLTSARVEIDEWYTRLESIALCALEDDGLNLEGFDEKVQEVRSDRVIEGVRDQTAFQGVLHRGATMRVPIKSAGKVSEACPQLLNSLVSESHTSYSLWWSDGSEFVEPILLIAEDLPPPSGFASMLFGKWNELNLEGRQNNNNSDA